MTTKTSKSVHSPLPWKVEPAKGTLCAWLIATEDKVVAFVAQILASNSEEDANAQLIIRAVNNHESLLSACKLALDDESTSSAVRIALEAAIQKAEGEL